MNNKILARVIAAVMAVAMLGTVSFAEDLTFTKDVTAPTESGQKTIMAFKTAGTVTDASSTVPADADIIYLDQTTGDYPTAKIAIKDGYLDGMAEGEKIWIRYGGTNQASASTFLVYEKAMAQQVDLTPDLTLFETVLKEIELLDVVNTDNEGGNTFYKGVAAVKYEIALKSDAKVKEFGVTFGKFDSKDLPVKATDNTITWPTTGKDGSRLVNVPGTVGDTVLTSDDGAKLTYKAVILGVPEDVVDGTGNSAIKEPLQAYGYAIFEANN